VAERYHAYLDQQQANFVKAKQAVKDKDELIRKL
jgi:hypothetical protein